VDALPEALCLALTAVKRLVLDGIVVVKLVARLGLDAPALGRQSGAGKLVPVWRAALTQRATQAGAACCCCNCRTV
jgi:hypothetical protein